MDAQLEATYEGPEAVQRRHLIGDDDQRGFPGAVSRVGGGDAADCIGAAGHRRMHAGLGDADVAVDAELICRTRPIPDGSKLYHSQRQGVTFAMADALCWLLASRCQILDVLELEARGAGNGGWRSRCRGVCSS